MGDETEKAWVGAELSVRDVQRLVSGRRPGDLPSTPADESARRHVVRFEVSGATLALLRQAEDEQRRRTGESIDDDALVTALAKAFLASEGPSTGAGAGAHVTVELCPSCERGTARAGGERVALDASEVERLACDARVLPAAREQAVRGKSARSHVGPPDVAEPKELVRRASLTVATELKKTVREAVIRRHGGKCAFPGCSNTAFLDVHHGHPRSEGGSHDPEHLLPLCDAHHRLVHEGIVVVDGTYSNGFVFRHADGTPYGTRALPDPRVNQTAQIVFGALCKLDFKSKDARAVVDAIRERITGDMPPGVALRMALQTIPTPSKSYDFRSQVREALETYLPCRAVA